MRVLHICASLSPEWGGPVTVIANLTHALEATGVKCTVFATTGRRVGTGPVSLDGVETRLFQTGPLARLWVGHAPGLARALSRATPDHDLVHIHELWHYPHYAAYHAALEAGKPYVVTAHGELDPWALGHKRLKKQVYMTAVQRRILQGAAALHAITVAEEKQIQGLGFVPPVAIIPNGICPETVNRLPTPDEFLIHHPDLVGKRIILFLGRIHPKKGLDILAKAFGQIVQSRQDVCLVIAGPDEGGYRRQVEDMLKGARALDRTVFTGMLTGTEKLAAFSASSVFVLPSYSEGFSMAILEAMACGLPVIISHQCRFPEVAEAEAGLITGTDAEQLQVALAHLMDHPEERREMGRRGRQMVIQKYTWDSVAAQVRQLYSTILQHNLAGVNFWQRRT
jgi:glycosyltransferase involved in cell wall biosynthesis